MFELVQFFNIKDISQLAPTTTEQKLNNSITIKNENDSFESSDVSYARASNSLEGKAERSSDLSRAIEDKESQPGPSIDEIADVPDNKEGVSQKEKQPAAEYQIKEETEPISKSKELSPETQQTLEECIRKGLSEQIEQTLLELNSPQFGDSIGGQLNMSYQRFKNIIKGIGADYFTMDELKEAFEQHGELKVLQGEEELMTLIDHYLPEQSGYGVFFVDNVIAAGLVWCSGIDLLGAPGVKGKQIEIHGDSDSEKQALMRAAGVVDEVIDEDEEASQLSVDPNTHQMSPDVEETPRKLSDPLSRSGRSEPDTDQKSGGQQESILHTEQSSQIVDDQTLFWDILNEH